MLACDLRKTNQAVILEAPGLRNEGQADQRGQHSCAVPCRADMLVKTKV